MIVLMTFQVDSPGTVLIITLLDILALDILGLGRFPGRISLLAQGLFESLNVKSSPWL